MPLTEAQIKGNIKTKLLKPRNNTTSAEQALDDMVDAIYEIVVALLQNATITGICPPNGGTLQQGKIT